jgi:lysyl-tRNA synthetase class 2
MMDVTETLVSTAIRDATGGYRVDYQGQSIDFAPPWRRMRYFDALREAIGEDLSGADETRVRAAGARLHIDLKGKVGLGQAIDEVFSETVEPTLIQPIFITDFPLELSPLAKKHRSQDGVVERFELFAGGMELANAFSEQNDPAAQAEAFARQGELREEGDLEAQMTDEDYLRALRIGMPPTGGVGIGIDRLVMVAAGAANIREVILFPQLRPEDGTGAGGEDGDEDTTPENETAETRV